MTRTASANVSPMAMAFCFHHGRVSFTAYATFRLPITAVTPLDAAHNADAWRTLAAELPPSFVAVVSVSLDKPPAELRVALEHALAVIATAAWPGRSLGAAELADVVGGEAIDDPRVATRAGLEQARARDVPLVVFGSAYLLRHALDELGL